MLQTLVNQSFNTYIYNMSRNEQILASVSQGNPNARAEFQGLLGYWCQADAVFIETLQPEPGEAIEKYRRKLGVGEIGISHNGQVDSLQRLSLLAQLAEATSRATKAESRAEGLQAELAEQEREKLELVREMLKAQDGHTTRMLTPDVLWERYKIKAAECPDCGLAVLAGEPRCFCGEQMLPTRYMPQSTPTPPPSSPAAAGPGEAGWFSPLVFDSAADYDASVARNIERIESGEVKPIEPDEDEREVIGTYETSGLPVYEGDDYVTDVEGCYLTRAEANELKADDELRAPTTTGEGKEGVQS